MNIRSVIRLLLCRVLIIPVLVLACSQPVGAAVLDDIYTPILPRDRFFYQSEVSRFDMTEEGAHGSTSFGDFESDPSLVSLSHSLRFSPAPGLEVETGYGQVLPAAYTRLTYDGPTAALDTIQDYTLHHLQDYSFQLRLRRAPFETYVTFREKRQKAKTDAVLLLNDTVGFDDVHSHYEDLQWGLRYLSEEEVRPASQNGYFQMTRPLLAPGQVNAEAQVGFKNGNAENTSDIYVAGALFLREYSHQLRPHVIPAALLRYGVHERLEVEGGLSYTSPFKYNYEFKQFNPTTTSFVTGTYKIEHDLKMPLGLTYRPAEPVSVQISSDFRYVKQRLDSWGKETDDSRVLYPVRRLSYFNTRPSVRVSYFRGADKQWAGDEFSSLTKPMLRHKQLLASFLFQKDTAVLRKADGNDPQNVIDPYSIFLYPLDPSVSGSEYGSFFLGNKTTRAAEVRPQNFYLLETALTYGLRDFLNVGVEVGYRSGNTLHHYTVHDLANRFYRFEPFYYFNFLADWQVKKNSLLSLKVHYVPQYKTFLETSVHPKQFEAETQYYETLLAWKILF